MTEALFQQSLGATLQVDSIWLCKGEPFYVLSAGGVGIPCAPRSRLETSVFRKKLEDIEGLKQLYSLRDPTNVTAFLLAHDYLIAPLFQVYEQTRKLFGWHVIDIEMEYDRDPEEDFEGLFVTVETSLSPEESVDLMERFDNEWWLDMDERVRMAVTIMVRSA